MKRALISISLFLLATTTSFAQTTSDKLFIHSVGVNNFTKSSVARTSTGDYLLVDSADYQIVYLGGEERFLISVYSTDFTKTRIAAENKIMQILGINNVDACKINITIKADYRTNPDHSKDLFYPSFCNQQNPDINNDGQINSIDYALAIKKYGRVGKKLKEDLNGDEIINSLDLSIILGKLGDKVN